MVRAGVTIGGIAVRAYVGLAALLGGVVHLELTLTRLITAVPLGTRRSIISLFLDFFKLLLGIWPWYGFYSLHHRGGVQLG